MPYIRYIYKKFSAKSLRKIDQAEAIIQEYAADGYDLTLRQLYYQFVARDLILNKQTEYKNLGSVISDGRLAGLIDWDSIVDRTRELKALGHWNSPADVLDSAAYSYRTDLWQSQPYRLEVWIEKDALVGVIEKVCKQWDVPYFSCKGYNSQSEMWRAGQRLLELAESGYMVRVLHLGDHDPSGIDMTRDIRDRLNMFAEPNDVVVKRIALNMEQVEELKPPPNFAKLSDARSADYIAEYGDESWELDALSPAYINDLIQEEVEVVLDQEAWAEAKEADEADRQKLGAVADEFRSGDR